MFGVFRAEDSDGDVGLFQDCAEAVGLGGGVRVVGYVEDEERGDALVLCDVGDGGEVAVLGGVVAELFAVAELCRGHAVDTPARLGGLDDGGDVVGVAVDGDAADQDVGGAGAVLWARWGGGAESGD